MQMKFPFKKQVEPFALLFYTILSLFFVFETSIASDLVIIQPPATGYQPQFQVSGNKIHYVWHEYDGSFRQIFTAEMNIDGTDWKAEKRTSG